MEYIALSKLAYSDRDQYEQTYQDRFNSLYAQHIDIKIGDCRQGDGSFVLTTSRKGDNIPPNSKIVEQIQQG